MDCVDPSFLKVEENQRKKKILQKYIFENWSQPIFGFLGIYELKHTNAPQWNIDLNSKSSQQAP